MMELKNETIGKYNNDQINEKITDTKGNTIRNYAIININNDKATITQNHTITTITTDDQIIQEIIEALQKPKTKAKPKKQTKKQSKPKKETQKETKKETKKNKE